MGQNNEKCVVILDESLPKGLLANTAAILGMTLGKQRPDIVGRDVADGDGGSHLGIVMVPVPVLQGTPEMIRQIRQKLPDFQSITAVDFSDLAQGCRTYEEWEEKIAGAPESSLRYLGLALCGGKREINALTGNLPLLR